jgi:hypothetical protein
MIGEDVDMPVALAPTGLCGMQRAPGWSSSSAVGKTVVSSGIIDRVVAKLGRKLVEMPVGLKWFADGASTPRRAPERHLSGATDRSGRQTRTG